MKKLVVPLVVLVVILASTLGCGTSGGSRTATERISADDGGSVTSTDGALTLEIPPGALAENTRISIREVDPDDLPDEFAEVGEGMGYELEPEGLVFIEPVTVSLSLDPESLEAEGGDGYEVFALLSWSEANGVEPLDAMVLEISAAEGEATLLGELDHFSFIRRIKSGLEVSLEEVNREQPVGGRFSALLHIVNISDGVNPVFSDVHGAFHAYGTVGLNGSGDFTVAGEMGKDHFDFESGNFLCKDTPGIGSYGVQVHALYTSGGAQT
ncbi:MAG TPA: hypothetical protein G4O08_02210, partial [Anaerolineae bacterium]|nr:hypothetical protein [Anaerolineae bacterium]